jgi:hypothetical protein
MLVIRQDPVLHSQSQSPPEAFHLVSSYLGFRKTDLSPTLSDGNMHDFGWTNDRV